MEKKTDSQLPFFARFLEGQDFPKVKTDIKAGPRPGGGGGGPPIVTMKWPSDDDEDPVTI
ncbi:MAG: microviridin/marinostatin family tricyclic proteinase inhibitor [Planctomycetes bacterium]|nr:microviridin/marinostatin family tricyclic proteinase inhibitor [Planctomycetota bacterium]